MKGNFEKIWKLAIPYLKKGKRKDFVLHTEGVVKAMKLLLEKEKGDPNILIPAAMLHDVGWSKVPIDLQLSSRSDEEGRQKALKLHLKFAPEIVRKILKELNYDERKIEKIVDIILAHKFQDPKELDKRLLIDADTLSDSFKDQFYSDAKAYGHTPRSLYEYRLKNNKFYTKTARMIFDKELEKRRKEIR